LAQGSRFGLSLFHCSRVHGMSAYKFNRWDVALKECMAVKKGSSKDVKPNRWNSDPMALNTEAHELPVEKQRLALDFVEEASAELKEKLAPMWRFCFVQWHIYDAGMEAEEQDKPLTEILKEPDFLADIASLEALFENGDLEKASTTEKWTWKLLEPYPEAGSIDPWNEETAAPVLQVSREERKDGVAAFAEGRHDKAYWHFWQGLKLVARAPATKSGPHAKLRADLYKNQSACALKMGMKRIALSAANAALSINPSDEKAWYRKASAFEAMGLTAESTAAMAKAGLGGESGGAVEAVASKEKGETKVIIDMYGREHTYQEVYEPPQLDDELEPLLHNKMESMIFIEMGVNSIAAVDIIYHIKAELGGAPIPLTLIYDCPRVGEAVNELLNKINADNEKMLRRKMVNTVWRAVCKTLGRDPVNDAIGGRSFFGPEKIKDLSEAEALSVLEDLQQLYETDSFIQTAQKVARKSGFEQRSFLVNLQKKTAALQKPILQATGYEVDEMSISKLECSIVIAAIKSKQVAERLELVRMAMQGGPNGMWAINVESQGDTWDDSLSMQSRANFMQADPFGNERKNTNSVYGTYARSLV